MAIWKEQAPVKKEGGTATTEAIRTDFAPRLEPAPAPAPVSASTHEIHRPMAAQRELRESLIASEITIEGKIQGSGHVRLAGRFKGDVHVQGNLAIENGAKLTGGVHAATVTIGGELEGNIDSASRVELLETGVLNGDLKAGSLTVAAGSRMRGQVEFGWDDQAPALKSSIVKTGGITAA